MTDVETGYDPRTGGRTADHVTSTPDELSATVAAAAAVAGQLAATAPETLAGWTSAVADALLGAREELTALADLETALGTERLAGEVDRAADQLRFYGSVARDGSHLGATIDSAPVPIARVQRPVGPVAVFGASNFPFAFGVLGHDTGSALAAGCPVVVKGHPAHPGLSRRLAQLATDALTAAGAPTGTFGLVTGFEAGRTLVSHPFVRAVAFTGSERGGTELWRLANERDEVIPVFAEMGTVNAVVVTPLAAREPRAIATGFVDSFTLGMGQFCTKPGLLLVPAGSGLVDAVADEVAARPAGVLLTEAIARDCAAGVERLVASGARVVQHAGAADGARWQATPTVLTVPVDALERGSALLGEVFGPVALVAEYADDAQLAAALGQLPGALAAAVHCAEDEDIAAVVDRLATRVGRVIVNGWPTGVATTWAQHHGGPWPATTVASATSVGAAALQRFLRPVAYQNLPDAALPEAVRAANPWGVPRRVDGLLET